MKTHLFIKWTENWIENSQDIDKVRNNDKYLKY